MPEQIVLGLDFGSDSVRTLAVSCLDGTEISSAVACYPHWSEGRYSDSLLNQFRQPPQDYIESMTTSVCEVSAGLGDERPRSIVGMGVDTTCSSTPEPIDKNGDVLSLRPEFAEKPNAMFVALGGIARKSPTVMQVCADVMNRSIEVVASDQCCALGTAIFGAVASGTYSSVANAQKCMASRSEHVCQADTKAVGHFEHLSQGYLQWVAQSEPLYAKSES